MAVTAKVSATRFISPVISLYIGFIFLSERLNINDYIGTVFILFGLILIDLKRSKLSTVMTFRTR